VYDTYDHHFHKKVHEGKPSDGALCVRCHAAERPYMVIDWRTDHSYRLPRPDLDETTGAPSACSQAGCHDDRPNQWLVDAQRRWYGLARRPHYGITLAAAREGLDEAREGLLRLALDELSPAIVRATALSLLDLYPGEDSTAVLEQALASDDPLIRHTATRVQVVADPARRAALLAPLLADPIRAVRLAAVVQLAGEPQEHLKPYQREAFERELADYRLALEHSLDFAATAASLGNLLTALGRGSEAERAFRQAVSIDDLFFPARMNLAVLLSARGRNDEAEDELRAVLEAYPENPDAAYSLGLLLVEMGQPEEAVEWLALAARSAPERARVHYNLGLLLQQLGRLDEAEQALTTAVTLEPGQVGHLHALADHYLRRRQPRRAMPLADRIIALAPDERLGYDIKTFAERMAAGG
jgi:tetratricopeptide (TPR) repeat protein